MDIVAKTQFFGGHNLHKILGFEPRDPVMNMFSKAEKNIRESAPVNRALALPGSGTITNTNRMPPFKCVENHPAGWVIECGGVAILMFVDPVPFGVLQWISCLFVSSLRLNSVGFIVFLRAGHQIWTFHPQKSILFWVGHFTKWQWGHSFGTRNWLHVCHVYGITTECGTGWPHTFLTSCCSLYTRWVAVSLGSPSIIRILQWLAMDCQTYHSVTRFVPGYTPSLS